MLLGEFDRERRRIIVLDAGRQVKGQRVARKEVVHLAFKVHPELARQDQDKFLFGLQGVCRSGPLTDRPVAIWFKSPPSCWPRARSSVHRKSRCRHSASLRPALPACLGYPQQPCLQLCRMGRDTERRHDIAEVPVRSQFLMLSVRPNHLAREIARLRRASARRSILANSAVNAPSPRLALAMSGPCRPARVVNSGLMLGAAVPKNPRRSTYAHQRRQGAITSSTLQASDIPTARSVALSVVAGTARSEIHG
jgi:hypothetical protein